MKKTKKLLAVLLSVLMLFSTVAVAVSAAPEDYAYTEKYGKLYFKYHTGMVAGISNIEIGEPVNGEKEVRFTVTLNEGYYNPYFFLNVDAPIYPEFISQDGRYVSSYSYMIPEDYHTEITVRAIPMRFTVEIINSKPDGGYQEGQEVGYGEGFTIPTLDLEGFVTDDGKEWKFAHCDVTEWGYVNDEYWENKYTTDEIVKVIEKVTSNIIIEIIYEEVTPCDHDSDPTVTPGWELKEIRKASCTEDGAYVYVCGRCEEGVIKEVPIKARGHKLSPWVTTKEPTCTEKGEKKRACLNVEETELYVSCLHIETADIGALGHDFGEWVVVTPPTCTEKGKAERTCNNDSTHKEYKDLDAKGHHDSDGDKLCDDCGEEFGHCGDCICHRGNVLSVVMRYLCTFLSRMFHTNIKCCECMEWYTDEISSIS